MSLKKLREDSLAIFRAGINASDSKKAVRKHLKLEDSKLQIEGKSYNLLNYKNIYVIGMGKASASMASAVEEILGEKIKTGIVNVKFGHTASLKRIKLNEAGHPLPDEAGVQGAEEIIDLSEEAGENDLIICLISGGGSALLPSPAEEISLEEKRLMTEVLLRCGATISEINAVRKHISRVKGGRLAKLAHPSTLISLILSDVVGNDLSSIASGPTAPDKTSFEDCINIIDKYCIGQNIPHSVNELLMLGLKGQIDETPKPGDPAFEKTQNVIVGSNITALRASRKKARELGYNTLILSSFIEGETKEIAKVHAALAKELVSTGNPVKRPACVISGGETTVKVKGEGLGGRNQEFVLAASIRIDGLENVVILSGGTDGTDGPTPAAGAIADGTTIKRAESLGLDADPFLLENDSHNFFKQLDDLIITGPTNTNVMDIRLVLLS